jgi:phosphocarrier protein
LQLEKKIKVVNRLGLHARPAALLVQTTNRFNSEITIRKDDMEINAKSIMGIMMLAAGYGSTLVIRVSGNDADTAMKAVQELFVRKFDEDDEGEE